MKKVISGCKYSLVPARLRRDMLISFSLQPLMGGPGQDVSCELKQRHFSLTRRHGRQGSRRWAIMYTLSSRQLPFSD